MKIIREHRIFILLLLVGLILRVIFIEEQGLSNDELSAWYRTRYHLWSEFWRLGVQKGDMHPGFYQFVLYFWLKLFGESEWAIRSLSLVFYFINSYLIYKIAIKYFTKAGGLLTIVLYTGLGFFIINTTFSRPYNSGVFFLLLAWLQLLNMGFGKTQLKNWLILILALTGAMLSHYFAFLTAGVLCFTALFYLNGKNRIYLVVCGLVSLLMFLPHINITLYHLSVGGLGWLPKPSILWPFQFLLQLFNDSWRLFLLMSLILIGVYLFNKRSIWGRQYSFSVMAGILVFVVGFTLSLLYTPVLRDLVMLFILPFLLLPLLSLLKFNTELKTNIFILSTLLIISLHSVFIYRVFDPIHFGVFKQIANRINENNERIGNKNIEFASNFNHVDYINYYLKEKIDEPITDWENQESLYSLAQRVNRNQKSYFSYALGNKFHLPMFLEVIRRKYPEEVDCFNTTYSYYSLRKKGHASETGQSFFYKKIGADSLITDEFINTIQVPFVGFPNLSGNRDYYLVEVENHQPVEQGKSLYLVATLERDGQQLLINDFPAMYFAFDQSRLESKEELFLAFRFPESVKKKDVVKFYIWNPEHQSVILKNYKISVVNASCE